MMSLFSRSSTETRVFFSDFWSCSTSFCAAEISSSLSFSLLFHSFWM